MICMTPEAISSYARTSIEARLEASRVGATFARPSLVDRLSDRIDLRRLVEAIRQINPRLSLGYALRRLTEPIRWAIAALSVGIVPRRSNRVAIRRAILQTLTARSYASKRR